MPADPRDAFTSAPRPAPMATVEPALGDGDVASRARQVELILSQLDALPTLSTVASRVMNLTSSEDADFSEIGTLIESDPALSARILSLCRRASVGMPSTITTVRRAVVMLGLEAVQSAVLSVDIYEVLKQMRGSSEERDAASDDPDAPPPACFDRVGFWHHSIAVACCAELLADAHKSLKIRPEEAFTAGLIHDLGKLILDWVLPKTYDQVVKLAEARSASLAQAERSIVGLDHHVVGKRMAEHWSLPHALQDVMWLHGQPLSALPEVKHRTLIGLITLCDAIVRRHHLGWSGDYCEPPTIGELTKQLGLDEQKVTETIPRLHEALAKRASDLGLGDHTSPDIVVQSITAANQRLSRLHQMCRERSLASRRQTRVLQAIGRFTSAARPGASVADVLAEVVATFKSLAGPGFIATLYQSRDGEAWRLTRYHADGMPATSALLQQPRDADGVDLDLRGLDHGGSLGGAIGLLTWLSEHLGHGPDLRNIHVVPMVSGVGPSAVLLHDRKQGEFPPADPTFTALTGAWAWAIAAAAQHDGARRLTEQIAETSRVLTETQAQLAEAQSMARLGELTAGAAHELNNPLTVISGRSQLLAQRLHNSRDRADAQQIAEAASRLSDLITRLHAVAQPAKPEMKPTEIGEIIALAIKRSNDRYCAGKPGIAAPKVRAAAQIPTGMTLSVDREQVIRSLTEIIINAMEAAPTTGVIIRARVEQGGDGQGPLNSAALVLSVQDDGLGMSDHALKHAFDPFFSEKPAGRQTGLGLPLARRLLELHSGGIRLESTPGRGTTVTVHLPIARAGESILSGVERASKAA